MIPPNMLFCKQNRTSNSYGKNDFISFFNSIIYRYFYFTIFRQIIIKNKIISMLLFNDFSKNIIYNKISKYIFGVKLLSLLSKPSILRKEGFLNRTHFRSFGRCASGYFTPNIYLLILSSILYFYFFRKIIK